MPSDAEFPEGFHGLVVEPRVLQAAFGGSVFVQAENKLWSLAADGELWGGRGNS